MRNDWLFRFADWIRRLGAPQSLVVRLEPDPVHHAGSFQVRVENIVNELQPNGLSVQWYLHVVLDEPLKLYVTESIARGLQRGDMLPVDIRLPTKEVTNG